MIIMLHFMDERNHLVNLFQFAEITMKDTKEKPSKLRPDSNQNVTKDKNDDELEESSHRNRTKAEKPEEKSKLGQSGSRNSIRPVSPKPTELTPQRPSRPTAARPQRPAKPTGTTPQQPKKPAESTPQQPETSESPNPESDDGKKDSDRSGRPNRPNRPNRPKRAFPGRNKLGNMRHEQPDKSKQINRQHNNTSNCSRTKGEGLRPCSNYIKNGTKPDKLEKDNSRNGTHNSTESHKTKRPGKHDKPEQHNKPMKNAQTNTAKPTGAPLQRPTKPNSARPQRPRPTKPLSVTERPMQQKVPGRGGKPKP